MPSKPVIGQARRKNAPLAAAAIAALLAGTSAHAAKLAVPVSPVLDSLTTGFPIPADAATRGMWAPLQNWPLVSVHTALLPNGKVATYGSPNGQSIQQGRTYDIWDPYVGYLNGSHVSLGGIDSVNSFCSTSTFLSDGQLLISGGIFDNGSDKNSALLTPTGAGVSRFPYAYSADRYYSTMLTLPDGRPLLMGGSYPYLGGFNDPEGSIKNGWMTGMTPEVFEAGKGWRSLFGAKSRDAFGPDNERFWYPRAWVSPRGDVFGISTEVMWTLNPFGDGAIQVNGWFKTAQNKNAQTAFDAPNVGPNSTAVMYDVGKIMQVGGNAYTNGDGFLSSNRATLVDINGANPVLTETAPMNFGRGWANSTLLPTGDVVVTGGSKYNDAGGDNVVLPLETWSPKTGKWTLGPSAAVYRGYHSSAILLQNGAVLTGGGGIPGPVNNLNAEVYFPPYLFSAANGQATWAARPIIQSVSTQSLGYGATLQLELSAGATASQVTFIPLGQTTHSFNTTQRFYPAKATQNGTIVTTTAPNSANIAPPGYYLVSAIDAKGVPSPSVIVGLGAGVSPPPGIALLPVSALPDPASAELPKAAPIVATHSNLCLQDSGVGVAVKQQTCTGAANQSWQLLESNSGKRIRNVGTKNCLDVWGAPAPGTMVSTYACHGQTNQTWPVSSVAGGTRYQTLNSGLCLSVRGANKAAGAEAALDTCSADPSQAFTSTTTTTTPPTTPPTTTTWTKCADENGQCAFTGTKTVRYGAGTTFTAPKQFTNGTACNNAVFGDPLYGTVKRCEIGSDAATPQPWTTCANEGGKCTFTTPMEIRYGAGTTFTAPRQFANGTDCNNAVFGDPLYGTVKRCEARPVTN